MSYQEDQQEPPEYFEDLPQWLQRALVQLLRYPESWITEPYATPGWVTNWRQASWAGFAAPASLAPFYATTMATTAMRAGWIPQPMVEYTYLGRQAAALQTAADYRLYGSQYGQMQTNLWQARAAYWGAQQQWAPIAEAWGAARLASFVFPEFGMIRAFGFPFYGAAQRLTTAAAMAPYVREALQYPGALQKIQDSSTFWAGQYGRPGAPFGEALTAQLISGVGEWTAAQTILWGLRPGAGLASTLRSTAFISFTQAGLGLIAEPLATLAVKQMWGLPLSQQERFEMATQMGIGAGMVGAGVYAGTQWGFIPSISIARTVQWTSTIPYTLSPAEVLAYQTATRIPIIKDLGVAYRQGRMTIDTGLTGLRGMPGETPWLRPIVSSERWGQPQWAEATYQVVGPTRLSYLWRMMGSVVGGQIGFEAMGGLATAYIEEAARRRGWTPEQRQLGLAIGAPLAGTAGLLVGSWLGAKLAGLGFGPLFGVYAAERAYGFFMEDPRTTVLREARQQANPLVPISPSERYLTPYPQGPAQLPLGIQGLPGIWQGLLAGEYQPVSPAERYGLVPSAGGVGALPPAAIEPGLPYNAAIQSWQYLAYGGGRFSRTQVGLQQAEAYRYSRAESGGINQAYWNRQGGISFYFTGTSIAEQQARAYPWYGGRYGAETYTTTYDERGVPRGWTPQQWAQAAYGYSRQESAMSPYSQIYQPQYETRLKTLAEAQSYQLYLSGAPSLWLAQNTFRITGTEGAYGVKLVRDIGTLGSVSLARYARSQVYGQTQFQDVTLARSWLDAQYAAGKINKIDYQNALNQLDKQAQYASDWSINIVTGKLMIPPGGIVPGAGPFGFAAALSTLQQADFTIKEQREALAVQYPGMSAAQIEGLMNRVRRGSCFVAGTLITMGDGSKKRIEQVRVGDEVLAFVPDKPQKRLVAKVTATFKHEAESYLRIRFYAGAKEKNILEVTDEHPVYCSFGYYDQGFLPAKALLSDPKLQILCESQHWSGPNYPNWTAIKKVERRKPRFRRKTVTVYNLHVNRWHTYFANGVGVHNKAVTGRPGDTRPSYQGWQPPTDVTRPINWGYSGYWTGGQIANQEEWIAAHYGAYAPGAMPGIEKMSEQIFRDMVEDTVMWLLPRGLGDSFAGFLNERWGESG